MSHYVCPKCNHKEFIFGENGGKNIAEDMNLEILGNIPLHISIRETSDTGTPVTVSHPDSPEVQYTIRTVTIIVRSVTQSDVSMRQLVDNINKQQNILRNLSSVNPPIVLMKYSFSFRHLSTNTSHQKLLTNYDGNFGNASGKFVADTT
jgi:hypothetical protein